MYAVSTVCVCGAGTMGSGIAQVAAMSGFTTIQFDVDETILAKSRALIEKNLQGLTAKGKLTETEKTNILTRLLFTSRQEQCEADLVIEAIIENREAKLSLLQELTAINGPRTIFATNTSSIAVTVIAASLSAAQRVVGMHFFNPAPLMKLVEVITTPYTEPAVTATVLGVAEKMGKTAVVCKDAPGFIVNRIARHYYLEAMRLLEQELATIETIDAAMEASGFKMGPFKLMDLIGMDINYSVSNLVWEALGKPERLTPSVIQQEKVKAGELGRKTGRGFYVYES